MNTNYGEMPRLEIDPVTGRARVRSGVGVPQAPEQPKSGSSSPYRSKLEATYANALFLEERTGLVVKWWHEPFSFRLADGKRYRVDFMVWRPPVAGSGSMNSRWIECIEVKGVHKNKRDSLTHLAWAAQKFPCFTWKLVEWSGHGWEEQVIGG